MNAAEMRLSATRLPPESVWCRAPTGTRLSRIRCSAGASLTRTNVLPKLARRPSACTPICLLNRRSRCRLV